MTADTTKLDGWGAIELYLGCTRKAVLRRGYIIMRHITGRVYAYKEELDSQDLNRKRPQTPGDNTPARD